MRSVKRSLVVAVVLVLGLGGSLVAQESPERLSYDLKVRIEPAAGTVEVKATVEIPPKEPRAGRLKFGLHETFAIRQLRVNGKEVSFSFEPGELSPMTPAFRNVVVKLPSEVLPGPIRLDIEYQGRLKELPEFGAAPEGEPAMDDQVNSRMVELACYSSWYPQFVLGEPIEVRMEVSLPQGWIAVGSGKKLDERVAAGRVVTRWFSATDIDPLIAAAPNYKKRSFKESGVEIEIYHTRMPEKFLEGEVRQVAEVARLYAGRLGETNIPGGTIRHVYSPKRMGQGMAGIARPGLIVTSEGRTLDSLAQDPAFSLFQPIAHEIAHFWWNSGVGQGDWINEAFAEYFSSVAVQKITSEAEFRSVMEGWRDMVRQLPAEAPSLAAVPFMNDGVAFVVRHFKGALMLDRFRQILGDDKFFGACREFFQASKGRSIGTSDFRGFWTEKLSDRKALVGLWLDSRGGLPAQDLAQEMNDRLDSLMSATYSKDKPGAAIAIVEEGKVVFKKGYGIADLDSKTSITSSTNFNIASMTKQFTAYCILLLQDQGKLSLDDKLIKFFPDFAPKVAGAITIRNLLTHNSGIVDHYDHVDKAQYTEFSDKDILPAIRSIDTVYFPAGAKYRYSNTAYCLLSLIIEKVSGRPFPEFVQDNIYKPLKMDHSDVIRHGGEVSNRAIGYEQENDSFKIADAQQSLFFSTMGDGGIYTSIDDYLKWLMAVQSGEALIPSLEKEARSPQFSVDSEKGLSYGFGWFIAGAGEDKLIYHPGSNGGFRTIVLTKPSRNYSVVIFSNRSDIDLDDLVRQVDEIYQIDDKAYVRSDAITS